MASAARLLADAGPAVICWNGSRGASFGFDVDRKLCARLTAETGLKATTATLAIDLALRRVRARRIGLVTPYRPAYVSKLIAGFGAAGYAVAAEAHANLDDNLGYALLPDPAIERMVGDVAQAGVDAIVTFCTNLPAAQLVGRLEHAHAIPVFDSTSAAVWASLRLADVRTGPGRAWGSLFE